MHGVNGIIACPDSPNRVLLKFKELIIKPSQVIKLSVQLIHSLVGFCPSSLSVVLHI
jgi:hypothetical protein